MCGPSHGRKDQMGSFKLGAGSLHHHQGPPLEDTLLFASSPLSPNKATVLVSLANSPGSLAFLRARRFSSCSSNHSLGDSLYRKSL